MEKGLDRLALVGQHGAAGLANGIAAPGGFGADPMLTNVLLKEICRVSPGFGMVLLATLEDWPAEPAPQAPASAGANASAFAALLDRARQNDPKDR